jgi:hypothetical protein
MKIKSKIAHITCGSESRRRIEHSNTTVNGKSKLHIKPAVAKAAGNQGQKQDRGINKPQQYLKPRS